jgi:hypothetical protein
MTQLPSVTRAQRAGMFVPPSRVAASEGGRAAAVRAFTRRTGEQGLTTLYIPRSRPINRSETRRLLHRLGVHTSRLIDVNTPTGKIISIAVHVQYAAEFSDILRKAKVNTIPEFDPTSETHLADPKHASLPTHERQARARQIHRQRMFRSLKFMKPHLSIAVAHYFHEEGWIEEADILGKRYADRDDPSSAFPRRRCHSR